MPNQSSSEEQVQVETDAPASAASVSEQKADSAHLWYILQCYSNHENKVRDRIQQLVDDKVFSGKVSRVLVPQEETVEIRNNKRVESTARIFPGYVFVEAAMDDEVGFEIRRIPGVVKFMGTKFAPTPVTENEILKVLRKVGDKSKKIEVDFEMGEVVKVVDGAFRGYSGPISDISPERGKLKALISIFGRETPVELDFDHVEKIVN